MGKAEERGRVDKFGLLPESVSKYGLRVCPWLSAKADDCGLILMEHASQ